MGYYAGIKERLPDEYDPWWEEHKMSNLRKMWMLGHESGYRKGFEDNPGNKELEHKVATMQDLWDANVRAIRKEIELELKGETV